MHKRTVILADSVQSSQPVSARGELFGHPRGLTFLFTTEMWERFSYYGMRSLLVLYMTKFLLLEDHFSNVIGLASLKNALEGVFGPLDVQPLSSQIWGLYTGLVYFTPIFGGLLADRVLGQRRTVVIEFVQEQSIANKSGWRHAIRRCASAISASCARVRPTPRARGNSSCAPR